MYNPKIDSFLCAADNGSFSKAAHLLHTTATTIMNHIRDLEAELNVSLFERKSNGIVLTESGRIFYREVLPFVHQANSIIEHTRQKTENTPKIVTLGVSHMSPVAELCSIWKAAPNKRNIQLSLLYYPSSLNNSSVISLHMDSRVDVLFSTKRGKADPYVIDDIPACSYSLTVAVPLMHRLAKKERLTLDDLSGETIAFPILGNIDLFYSVSSAVKKRNSKVHIKGVSIYFDFDFYNKCAENGQMIISLSAWNAIHPGMVNLPVDWGENWQISYSLFWRKDARPEVLDFIEAFKEGLEADRKEREG